MTSPRIPTPTDRIKMIEPCELVVHSSPNGWHCETHKVLVSADAVRCRAVANIQVVEGLLHALDVATEALQEVYDHYTPGSPGNGDTPSSAWMEVEYALIRLGYKVHQ